MTSFDRSPTHLLHRAGQCAEIVFHSEMNVDGLTPRQLAVLTAVAGEEGQSQTDLVARTGVDRSTLADIVRRMVRKGLLQRRRTKEDARAYAVKLTEHGRTVLKAATPLARKADARLLEALPDRHRDSFVASLAAVVDALAKLAPEKGKRP